MRVAARLLLWSLAVVVIDGAVILRDDDGHASTRSSGETSSTSASASTTVTSTSTTGATPSSSSPTVAPDSAPSATTTTVAPSSPGETVVAHLQGDGETSNSATFDVVGRWELRWHVDDGGQGVAATFKDNRGGDQGFFLGLVADGSINREGGCSCTMELVPDGSAYDVLVVDLDG